VVAEVVVVVAPEVVIETIMPMGGGITTKEVVKAKVKDRAGPLVEVVPHHLAFLPLSKEHATGTGVGVVVGIHMQLVVVAPAQVLLSGLILLLIRTRTRVGDDLRGVLGQVVRLQRRTDAAQSRLNPVRGYRRLLQVRLALALALAQVP
jgi:hypothetical protein